MNKYYIPDISDLFIGYECEVYAHTSTKLIKNIDWSLIKIGFHQEYGSTLGINQVPGYTKKNQIRTPYITKEQIEKEGFIYLSFSLYSGTYSFEKGNRFVVIQLVESKNPFTLTVFVKDPSIEETVLGVPSEHFKCTISCPSINEFRKIMKLLGI